MHVTRQAHLIAAMSLGCSTALAGGPFGVFGSFPPPGATSSTMVDGHQGLRVGGERGALIGGHATFGGEVHAGLWRSQDFMWTDLHPAGATESRALSAARSRLAGYATFDGADRAQVWHTSGWRRDLTPAGSTGARAHALRMTRNGMRAAGWAEFGGTDHAGTWRNKSHSWVDLHPVTASASRALAEHAGFQAGWAEVGGVTRASMWSGSAASWIDLQPAVATASMAMGILGNRAVGWAEVGGAVHASRWTGAAMSWEDLHPEGATASMAHAINGSRRVFGWAEFDGQRRATHWNPHGDVFDIHGHLDGNFAWSEALGAWRRGHLNYVVGQGLNLDTGNIEALYWSLPSPGAASLLGLAGLVGARRRR